MAEEIWWFLLIHRALDRVTILRDIRVTITSSETLLVSSDTLRIYARDWIRRWCVVWLGVGVSSATSATDEVG